ncbi:MAG TPA: non-homologous end-joining DNA ligase [Rhabdochlamydiaceae bacterium]|nr:non-homologous end-joining DNA ligase [Rhabdochlamydiaceae bacterium]
MSLKLSHLDKLYWDKITKGEMLKYYELVAPVMLPYLKNRPLVMNRFPDGIKGVNFYQKDAGKNLPKFVKTTKFKHENRTISYLVAQNKETLLYAANLGSIEMHVFNGSLPHLSKPDYMVFDLDPEKISYDAVVDTALVLHEILEEQGMKSFCKTSGASGMHIFVPMRARHTYPQVVSLAKTIAQKAQERLPKVVSLERNPAKRQKKVYIDVLQNNETKMIVAAYSVRARPYATVSTPLLWKEVKHGLDPRDFTIKTVPKRLKNGDPFKGVLGKGFIL